MSKKARIIVLAIAIVSSAFAATATGAGAVTWHNTGDTAFTTDGYPGTLSVTGVNLTCTDATTTGTSPSGSVTGNTYTGATGTMLFTGCSLSGIPTSFSCNYSATLTSQSGGVSSGNVDMFCSVSQFGAEICKVEGQRPISYTNPTYSFFYGEFNLGHATTLRTTNGSAGSCPLGVGEPSTATPLTLELTSGWGGDTTFHLGPRIARTA